ncbi:MAG: glycosyltransferase [Microbacteriaceae bacterium]
MTKRLWEMTPKPVQDAIASSIDRLRGFQPDPIPLPEPSKPVRLFIGPVNYAGQGHQWARAVELLGDVSARNFVNSDNNVLQYPSDYQVPWRTSEHSRRWQRELLDALSTSYTHVLFEACFPVLGGMFGGDVAKQVALLQSKGLSVGIVGHGTDVRLPSRHVQQEPWSMFHSDDWVRPQLVEDVVGRNLRLIDALNVPTFVSTAGLLLDVPKAHFLGVIIDATPWRTDAGVLEREQLKVIHAPTNTFVKGSDDVRPIARKLHDEGIIEFVEIERIPHEQMPGVVQSADVVLDQFRIGDYGVAACESMAAGRLCLAHVSDQVRDVVGRAAGMDLPIPETTLNSLETRLRDIAANRDRYRAIAAKGPDYVQTLHSGSYSREVLSTQFLHMEGDS